MRLAVLGKRVHVGPDEFRDMADRCHLFSGLDVKDAPAVGPHELFEVVPLDDDAVGLRALSNGKFARVRAPGRRGGLGRALDGGVRLAAARAGRAVSITKRAEAVGAG